MGCDLYLDSRRSVFGSTGTHNCTTQIGTTSGIDYIFVFLIRLREKLEKTVLEGQIDILFVYIKLLFKVPHVTQEKCLKIFIRSVKYFSCGTEPFVSETDARFPGI